MRLSNWEREFIRILRKLSVEDRELIAEAVLNLLTEDQSDSIHEKRLIQRIISSISMIGRRNSSSPSPQVC